MIIDDYIVVKIGDGELRFHNPEFRAWAVITGLDEDENNAKLSVEDKAKRFWENLAEVDNIVRRDGSSVTLEDIRELKHPMSFYHQARKGFITELTRLISGAGAEAKNESTAG